MAVSEDAMTRLRSEPALRYANFESRFVAGVLDTLVLFIIAAVTVAIAGIVLLVSSDFGDVDPSDGAYYTFIGLLLGIIPLWAAYFLVSWAWRGQTIGKAIMQIVIVRSNGWPLGVTGALARLIALSGYPLILAAGIFIAYLRRDNPVEVAAFIAVAIALVLAGVLWAAFDEQRRSLHDRIAGTVVVRLP